MNRDVDDLRRQVRHMAETLAESGAALNRERQRADRAEVERDAARKALEPFAHAAGFWEIESQTDEGQQILVKPGEGFSSALTVRNFRTAQRVIRRQRDTDLKEQGGEP